MAGNFPISRRLQSYGHEIVPTENAATDTANLFTLIDRINAGTARPLPVMIRDNGKKLLIDNGLDGVKVIYKPLLIFGESKSVTVQFKNKFQLNWGGYGNIYQTGLDSQLTARGGVTKGTWAGSAVPTNVIGSPSISIAANDFVVVWSDNTIPNTEHSGGANFQRPGEIHRVEYVDGSGNLHLDSPTVDVMNTNPQIAKIALYRDAGLCNLTLESDQIISPISETYWAGIDAFGVENFRMDGVTFNPNGPGYVFIDHAYGGGVSGMNCLGMPNEPQMYGVVFGVCRDTVLQDSNFHNVRHLFTTGGTNANSCEYGTSFCKVINCQGHYAGNISDEVQFTAFDTHAAGYGIEFINCQADMMGANDLTLAMFGFSSRSRYSRYVNCKYIGKNASGAGRAFTIKSHAAEIINCVIQGCAQGITPTFNINTSTPYQAPKVLNTIFRDCRSPYFHHSTATSHTGAEIRGCTFETSGQAVETGYPQRCLIGIHAGNNHIVADNVLKWTGIGANLYSVDAGTLNPADIQILGNYTLGYENQYSGSPSGRIGMAGDTGDLGGTSPTYTAPTRATADDFQAAYGSKNYTT